MKNNNVVIIVILVIVVAGLYMFMRYQISSTEELLDAAATIHPQRQQSLVAVDAVQNRQKLKKKEELAIPHVEVDDGFDLSPENTDTVIGD